MRAFYFANQERKLGDIVVAGGDKHATELLVRFACDCALEVVKKIKPYTDKYELIVSFLEDPTARSARSVARAADAAAYTARSARADAAAAGAARVARAAARVARAADAAASAAYAASVAARVARTADADAARAVVYAAAGAAAGARDAGGSDPNERLLRMLRATGWDL